MTYTIQVDSIQFPGHVYSDGSVDKEGAVYYLLLQDCGEGDACRHVCKAHPRMTHRYERQAFMEGAVRHREGATPEQIANDEANVWGWDGNRERPTLTPSFSGPPTNKKGQKVRDYNVHLFLTNGAISLCGDSTVTVHPNPVKCDLEA